MLQNFHSSFHLFHLPETILPILIYIFSLEDIKGWEEIKMLPTKEQLAHHLSEKMTNQDIANIYGTTFWKIIQLIKKYGLNPKELRKVEKYIVYEHWLNG